ncbi:hypothetical protein GCM10007190_05760 [Macrococcus hajekii]|nr:hypothetical protein [Macrococcus hajekii]GGB00486.1 hypothetical protein GCM10007190_05760 [Macrococcus hajekii]
MKKRLAELNIYQPGKMADVLKRELSIEGDMMKLSSFQRRRADGIS